jgi:ABC-type nitrate/sulfonate/bicarbonate transport system permease component
VLPVAAPSIFTGVRIAFGNGWMALVGAELVVGKQGLGFLISQGQINDSVATIFVGMIAIGALGAVIDVLLQRAQHVILPWKTASVRPLE